MTAAQLAAAMGCTLPTAEKFLAPFQEAMLRAQINTPLRTAHWLSQIGHECGGFHYLEELADGSAYENRKDLGNDQPGDGRRFKGRGLIQVTGRSNYRELGVWCGESLIVHPEKVATDLKLACLSAAWYWASRGCNRFADKDDIEALTRKVNGGLNGLPDRQRRLNIAKTVLGIPATAVPVS